MPFITLPNDVRVEVFYMNQSQCDNYNAFHHLRETSGDDVVTPGYYYEDMIGPYSTKNAAIESAKNRYSEEN